MSKLTLKVKNRPNRSLKSLATTTAATEVAVELTSKVERLAVIEKTICVSKWQSRFRWRYQLNSH